MSGASFSSPLFATVLASELSPTAKRNYINAFTPQFIASTVGFVIFFGVTGSSMLGSYELRVYEYRLDYLLIGVLLGAAAAGVLVHSLFPGLPIALCVGTMLAAVPGAFLSAPLSLILLTAGTIGIGAKAMIPIAIAVITAHLLIAVPRRYLQQRKSDA